MRCGEYSNSQKQNVLWSRTWKFPGNDGAGDGESLFNGSEVKVWKMKTFVYMCFEPQ